jgi:hypothetical protein
VPDLPPADVDADFDELLENLNGAFMLIGEARKGRFGLFIDLMYVNVEAEDSSPTGHFFSSITVESESTIASLGGFYRLYEAQGQFVDLMAGLRYWSIDTELSLEAGTLPSRKASHYESWVTLLSV